VLSCCLITARCNRNYIYRKLIKTWREHFLVTDSVLDRKYARKPQMPVGNVLCIQEAFVRILRKLIITSSCEPHNVYPAAQHVIYRTLTLYEKLLMIRRGTFLLKCWPKETMKTPNSKVAQVRNQQSRKVWWYENRRPFQDLEQTDNYQSFWYVYSVQHNTSIYFHKHKIWATCFGYSN
jgi:hypothetical protein